MRLSDAALRELSQSSLSDMRTWLRLNQPQSTEDRSFWWENLIARALLIVYTTQSEPERLRYAALAYGATLESVDQGVRRRVDGAVRIANLTVAYLNHGGCENDVIDVDAAVARNLDLIEVPPGIATEQALQWQTLPLERIRELRDVKELIQPCVLLASRVKDPTLHDRLAQWLAIWEDLP